MVGPVGVALASLVDENRVAINVAPRQFLDYRFVERLRAQLAECRLPTSCIELDLTESVWQTGAAPIRTLEQLGAMDIAVALDDFGQLFMDRVARAAADQPREALIVVCSRASMRARGPLRLPAQQ